MKSWTRVQKTTVLLTFVYASVFVGMLTIRPGTKQFYYAFFNSYQILPPLFAGVCGLICYRKGLHKNPIRRFGRLVTGLGCLSWASGQSIWTYFESIRGIEVPFPGWADAGYLGGYLLLVVGVLLMFGSMPIAGRARQMLDSAIAASSVGVLSWYFIVQRLWHQSDVSTLGKVISIAYPLGDIAALFGAVVLLTSMGADRNLRRSLLFLASGIIGFTFFDTSFTWMSLNGTYETGSWSDWTVSFGWLSIAYSFLTRMWWMQPEDDGSQVGDPVTTGMHLRSMRQIIMPYVAVMVAVSVVAVHDYASDKMVSDTSVLAGVFLMALVIVRQVLTLMENRSLTGVLKAFNDNLEGIVAQRTEQLTALHNLTKAITTTLQPDEVLQAAITHTRGALRADAVVIWLVEDIPGQDGVTQRNTVVKLHTGLEENPEMLAFLAEQPVRDVVDAISLISEPHSQRPTGSACLRAPLRWQQGVSGMIGVVRWNSDFGATECQLLESIGLEIGTTLENARLYAAAVEAADIDSVTGLLNHRALHQRFDIALKQCRKQKQPLSVIMMDLDNFKLFNDTYGHPVGDQQLKLVGQTLVEVCRGRNILGRYGGDEFLAILPNTDPEQALSIAQALRSKMDATGFQKAGEDRVVPLMLSFGIASFPADSDNRHELLTIADANLYEAKNSEERIGVTTETQRLNRQLRGEGSFAMLDVLVTAVDNKDRYTRRHSENVTEYALWIAEEMGLSEETSKQIRMAGLMHDVGKIGVPDEILRKPGRLTAEERESLQRHPSTGALVVSAVQGMDVVVEAVRCHHERWDGQGYPGQLSGEEIPLIGRIMAVADAYSAMTTDRSYRRALDWDTAMQEIRANRGTQFDPAVVDAFLRASQKRLSESSDAQDSDLPMAA